LSEFGGGGEKMPGHRALRRKEVTKGGRGGKN